MDYSLSYFGKSIENLTYSDISNFFIEEQEESERIEFKAYSKQYGNFNKNLDGVIRAICAFLNSDGGILIWGAPEGVQDTIKKIKIFKGNLSPVETYMDKDRLINKVSDSLIPLPVGIKVKPIEENGGYVYVFEIQKSIYSPHQFKNIYYARLDGQTKPAPHYLIDALFRKISYPNIEGYLSFVSLDLDNSNLQSLFKLNMRVFIFNFSELENEENIVFSITQTIGKFQDKNSFQYYDESIKVLHCGTPQARNLTLLINPTDLFKKAINLKLTFGGKKSPAKISEYELNFSNLAGTGYPISNCNQYISKKEENKLFSEVQKDIGKSKEDMLKIILER